MIDHPHILTEKEVQKISLSALRSYYRFRVKADTPELISDVRGTGGIIADVQYSFPLEDGTRFMATLEATALDSKEEVYFKIQKGLLLIDSLAFGFFVTGLLLLLSDIFKWELVVQYSIFTIVIWILASTLAWGAVFYWLFRKKRRYRYIYAVEQFKQYYANEQWIAISEDVFPDHQNRSFQELREQCILYGFGLIQIDRARKPHLIITPARKDVFDNRRRRVVFYTRKQLERLQRGGAQFAGQVKQILGKLPMPSRLQQLSMPSMPQVPERLKKISAPLNPSDPAYLFRFKRSYRNQLVLMGFSLAMVVGVFLKELPQRPKRFLSQRAYVAEVIAEKESHGPEPVFSMDPYDTIYIEPIDTNVVSYMELIRMEQVLTNDFKQVVQSDILSGMRSDVRDLYDCQQFLNLKTPEYLILEGIYPDFESASQRMSQLLQRSIEVSMLWMRCFGPDQNQYLLYFEPLQNTQAEAQQLAKKSQQTLDSLQLNAKVDIRVLSKRGGLKIQTLNLR